MKCPHCDYSDVYCDHNGDCDEGTYGEFFKSWNPLSRETDCEDGKWEYKTLFGCPCCQKTFID